VGKGVGDDAEPFLVGRKPVEREKAHGIQRRTVGALRRRLESADLVNPIVVEDHPNRMLLTIVNIDHPSPDCEIPGLLNEIDATVPGSGEAVGEPSLVEELTGNEQLDLLSDGRRDRQRLEQRARRNHDHADVATGHSTEDAYQLQS
jgi:hypothetical protein